MILQVQGHGTAWDNNCTYRTACGHIYRIGVLFLRWSGHDLARNAFIRNGGKSNFSAITDALLDAAPADIGITVRRPLYYAGWRAFPWRSCKRQPRVGETAYRVGNITTATLLGKWLQHLRKQSEWNFVAVKTGNTYPFGGEAACLLMTELTV